MKIVAERIRALRKSLKLSQARLGQILGVRQASLNRYEQDQCSPSYETLLRYADYFDVSLDYIFGRTDQPEGKLYERKIKFSESDPELERFVEMCFDPESPISDRLKKTLVQMLREGME